MTGAALPLASGVLLALSLPPFPSGPLPFLALVPLALFVADRPADAAGARAALVGGLITGAAFFALLLHWIPFAFPARPLTGVGYWALTVAVLALFPAVAAWATHRGVRRLGLPLWACLAVAWAGAEWLRGVLPLGLAFPWGGMALGLAGRPAALASLPWVGEAGVALWIAAVNGLLATIVLRRRGGAAAVGRRLPAAYIALATLPIVIGAFPDRRADGGTPLRVALVGTGVSPEVRLDGEAGARAMAGTLDRLLAGVEPGSVDLIVLPETAFPVALEVQEGRRWMDLLRGWAARSQAPLLVGGYGAPAGAPAGIWHNSAFLIGPEGVRGRYDKERLVPGIERAPPGVGALLAARGDTAWYAAGDADGAPLLVGGVRLGVLVCYESAFAGLARARRAAGADILINLTNDAWFGGGWPGDAARAQHVAHLTLRAIETGAPVLRAANGGPTLWVDAGGHVREAIDVEGVLVASVHPGGRRGLAARGVWAGPLAAAALVLLAVVGRAPRNPGERSAI